MHDDMSSILRGYTEEAVSRSRKEPHSGRKKQRKNEIQKSAATGAEAPDVAMESPKATSPSTTAAQTNNSLANFSEDQLMMELARRKASRFRKPTTKGDSEDPTGQVCTLNGGNGTIPCRDLME